MSRLLKTFLIIAALTAPVAASAADVLPSVIQSALHDAATTGNPLVVDAVADRMGTLFPSYRSQINSYVQAVVDPATQVMSSINTMIADIPKSSDNGLATLLFDPHAMNDEGEAAMAADLNDLDVGAGGNDKASVLR